MRLIGPITGEWAAWNTGRLYAEGGQKIAVQAWEALEESGEAVYGVLMLDVSRMVEYFLVCLDKERAVDVATSRIEVMKRYDYNEVMKRYDYNTDCRNAGEYLCVGQLACGHYRNLREKAHMVKDMRREGRG